VRVLLLFDIDGTLVAGAAREHSQALREAVTEVHGVDVEAARRGIDPAGRTDGEIARLMLLGAGVSAERIDDRAELVRDACYRNYLRLVPADLSGTVVAGIPELLEWLSGTDGPQLSLLTGNFEPVARIKLARAGLARFFAAGQGAFGSDSEDRSALPMIARRRAGSTGHPVAREQTVVIGDTPRDIACARADGVRCIAVATGPYGLDELAEADAAVSGAQELRAAIESMLAGSG
jgi:phosphoglycolate phosphatase